LVPIYLASLIAISLHAICLYHAIDLPSGQDISFLNMLSFLIWLMAVILFIAKSPRSLLILIFPLAAISVLLPLFFHVHPMVRPMSGHPGQWVHVWLSAITFSIICIAAFQAILLYLQDILLHRHYLPGLVRKMPALESMERFLFQMIVAGFILLTLICMSSAYFFSDIFQPPLLKKTLIAFIVWIILFVLLLGRYLFGWRGRKAVGYTLAGFVLLILIYFGSALFIH
jgi:ABC-type uncharacterized transport system permease subunit